MILKDLREEKNLTQKEVCTRTGIPYNTYRRYEYDEREPGFAAIISLTRLYHMRPGDLFELLCRERGYLGIDNTHSEEPTAVAPVPAPQPDGTISHFIFSDLG